MNSGAGTSYGRSYKCLVISCVKPGKPLTPSCVAALPPPSVNVDSITNDSMSLSFTLNSQYKVRASPQVFFLCFLVPVCANASDGPVCFFQVEQYTVILSWQFDTHVKENRNYTLTSGVLKGTDQTVVVTRAFVWQCGCWRVLSCFQLQTWQQGRCMRWLCGLTPASETAPPRWHISRPKASSQSGPSWRPRLSTRQLWSAAGPSVDRLLR